MIPSMYPIPILGAKKKHCKWSKAEDAQLRNIMKDCINPDWLSISRMFKNRNPRQCQERWCYYLSPDVNNGPWSPDEDKLLFEKYEEFGSKWSVIAKFFKGRTNTNVKNMWLSIQRNKERAKCGVELEFSNNVTNTNSGPDTGTTSDQISSPEFVEMQAHDFPEIPSEVLTFEDDFSDFIFDSTW